MVPSSTPNPVSGTQSVSYCPLRTTSEMLVGTHSGSVPSQQPFASLVPSRSQLNSGNHMRLLGNIPNVSSFLNDTASPNLQHQSSIGGAVDMVGPGELDPLSFISPSVPSQGQHLQNMSANQLAFDNSQPEQLDGMQNFQRQLSMAQNQQQIQLRGGLGNVGSVVPGKVEPQLGSSDQNGPPQHLHSLCSTGAVKLEPQQLHSMRGLDPFKLERQHSDAALFLQQQQLLQMPRPRSQAAAAQISLLQQQRILQQQQQQILKNLPQQRNQLQQQLQQNLLVRPQVKPTFYEPGMCARRLIHYMYHQRHRPDDNNIEFWRKFVAEYFAPNAKKRWCVSLYGSGRQTNGVFPQDAWYCEICTRKPGRGFETTFEVLPRLFQMKYASGTLEELLDVDMPQEYQNASGQIVLDYAKAIQESVFEQLRVVRQGQLRIVFSPDLKICSWEFCARRHEELIPRRLLMPQVSQLGTVFQKYQNAAQNSPSGLSAQDLQSTCNLFVATARQLAKTLEVPLVNDLGYTKRYVRCLQISEVVNSMKDLIDVSKETGSSPMDSLINFSKRTFASSGLHPQQVHQPVDQQMIVQSTSQNDQISAHASPVQLSSASNAVMGVANSLNDLPSTCATITNSGLRQSSMNARLDNHTASENGRHVGNTVQIPSTSSSSSLPSSHPNISSPFPSPMPSTSNNITPLPPHNTGHLNSAHSPVNMYTRKQLLTQSHEDDSTDTQSSVQQILQEMMMSSQLNGINSLGNELKGINGLTPALNVGSCRVGSAIMHNSSVSGMGLETMGGIGPLATAATSGTGVASNAMAMNGQVGINYMLHDPSSVSNHQQQDMGDRFLGGLGPVNNFNNLQFDWKSSP